MVFAVFAFKNSVLLSLDTKRLFRGTNPLLVWPSIKKKKTKTKTKNKTKTKKQKPKSFNWPNQSG